MTIDNIVEIPGTLRDAYKQTVQGTFLCVDQINAQRRTKLKFRGAYTGDGNVYSLDGRRKTPTWRITREVSKTLSGLFVVNPVLKNIDDASKQLRDNENYQVTPADFKAVKKAPETVTADLTQLGLEGSKAVYCCLPIDTSKDLRAYNPEQQKALLRVFGPSEDDYSENMKMLRDSHQKIKETRIFVLNPEYVREKAVKGPIGRASWRNDFDDGYSGFFADVRIINDYGRVFGVRRRESR